MKTIHPGILFALVSVAFFGCISVNKDAFRSTRHSKCTLVMIYGGGPSTPSEGERPGEQRMTVYAELSDTTYEFGHVADDGEFVSYFEGTEGRFRTAGGATLDFAIRELPILPAGDILEVESDPDVVGEADITGEGESDADDDSDTELEVYPVDRYASCEFKGPMMQARRAIIPPMDEPYQSIVTFTYLFSGPDTVTVELTTSSPNGFILAR